MTEHNELREIEIEIGGETFRSGTSKGRRLVMDLVDDTEENRAVIAALKRLVKTHGEYFGTSVVAHRTDEEGDRITVGELLDRHEYTAEELQAEVDLAELNIEEDLAVGDVVTVTDKNGDKEGVVKEIHEAGVLPARADITWDGYCWSRLENKGGNVRIGRGNMMRSVYDVTVEDVDDASDEVLHAREQVLESHDLDERVAESGLEVVDSWSKKDGRDRSGKLVVSGGPLGDEEVTIRCVNVFDGGWVPNVEGDVDEDTRQLLTRFARENSPVPTHIRM